MKFLPKLRNLKLSDLDNFYHLNFIEEDQSQNTLAITFLMEEGGSFSPIKDLSFLGIAGSELVKNAFQNLKNCNLDWKISDHILELNADNASAKILDKDFLKSIALQLETDKFYISIPQNISLLACGVNDESVVKSFLQKSAELFGDFGREPLSNLIFIMDGEGILQGQFVNNIKIKAATIALDYDAAYQEKIDIMPLFQELYAVRITCESHDVDILRSSLKKSINNVLIEHLNKKDFTGNIEIHSAAGFPFKTVESIGKIKDLLEGIKSSDHLITTVRNSGKSINISFLFGEDFQTGDIQNKISIII